MKFSEFNICTELLDALQKQGYKEPSPIQEQAIPPVLEGRDLLGCAQTGSGKTAAFAIPILQRLSEKYSRTDGVRNTHKIIRSLILTPTRELAVQIQDSFVAYGKYLALRCGCVVGGVNQKTQERMLANGVDILVATPGRLNDLLNQKIVNLSEVEILVLDEADRMLDMGFLNDVKKIITHLRDERQTLLFSATMPQEIVKLINTMLRDYVKVAVNPVSSTVDTITQKLYFVDTCHKKDLLLALLDEYHVHRALVFTRTKHGADALVKGLTAAKVSAEAIHGNKSQANRQRALSNFKSARTRVLIATDIAARGIDIDGLEFVFNFNLPEESEMYVHRIGRTGRAGMSGTAISFCNFEEKSLLRDIEKLIKQTVPVVEEHDYPMTDFTIKPKKQRGQAQRRPAAAKGTISPQAKASNNRVGGTASSKGRISGRGNASMSSNSGDNSGKSVQRRRPQQGGKRFGRHGHGDAPVSGRGK